MFKFKRQSSTTAFEQLEATGFRKEAEGVLDFVKQSFEQFFTAEESANVEFKEKLARAPAARSVSDSHVLHTKSEVILTRVWSLLKAGKIEGALETLRSLEGVYKLTDCVPGASDDLPLWALMPSLLSRTDALASLPVWRFILKKLDVAKMKHTDIHGNIMTAISISAAFDLDDYVRAVIAEEQLQGTVKEQVAFAQKCEVLQHNCHLMIEAMRLAAANKAKTDSKVRRAHVYDIVHETLTREASDRMDEDMVQKLAAAISRKVAADSDKQLLDSAFALMRDALISLTKAKRCVLSEVWNLCWEWQKSSGEKSLWLSAKQKIKDILSFPELQRKATDWQWYLQNWANSPVMAEPSALGGVTIGAHALDSRGFHETKTMATMESLEEVKSESLESSSIKAKIASTTTRTKFDDLCDMCETQLLKQKREIEEDMGRMIGGNEDAWAKVGCFKYSNPLFPDAKSWRQDHIKYGVKAGMRLSDLSDISLFTSSLDFDAAQTYDMDSYLTDVLTKAHSCNPSFQKFMQEVYNGICEVHSGPVKGIERCQVKAQLEYCASKFPTSARIIDLVRCSLMFEDIGVFYETLKEFSRVGRLKKISKPRRRQLLFALEKHGLKLDILRCKNGHLFEGMREGKDFTKRSVGGGLPVPSKYGDVKLNVIVTDVKRKVAVIGEVQFLLSAMLKAKLGNRGFYEVTRRKAFFHSVRKHVPVFTRNLRIAGSTQRLLIELLVRQPLWFTPEVFTKTDSEGRNILMRLVTTKALKVDLVKYLFALPTGVPDDVWLQKTEANMTLLKYVLALASSNLMALFLSKIPAHIQCEVWTLAEPLLFAMEMRDTISAVIMKAIPTEVGIWEDSELVMAAIQNRSKKGLLDRLRLLKSQMPEKLYAATLRKPLPSSKLNMTPLMTAIRFHGIDAEVIDCLIPVFEDTTVDTMDTDSSVTPMGPEFEDDDDYEKLAEMVEYWTQTADSDWTVLTFATKYSDSAGMDTLTRRIPSAALEAVVCLSLQTETEEVRRAVATRKLLAMAPSQWRSAEETESAMTAQKTRDIESKEAEFHFGMSEFQALSKWGIRKKLASRTACVESVASATDIFDMLEIKGKIVRSGLYPAEGGHSAAGIGADTAEHCGVEVAGKWLVELEFPTDSTGTSEPMSKYITIFIASGDIRRFEGDAIVNAANCWCTGGDGGVDGAITAAGGPLLAVHRTNLPVVKGVVERCATGDAVMTPSGHRHPLCELRCRYVVHAVGPNYVLFEDTLEMEQIDKLLTSSYCNALLRCHEHNLALQKSTEAQLAKRSAMTAKRVDPSLLEFLAQPTPIRTVAFSLISSGTYSGSQSLENIIRLGLLGVRQTLEQCFTLDEVFFVAFDVDSDAMDCLKTAAPTVFGSE